ncbi:hypothetical protein SLE2022_117830 [Rubroshorea leprosula]
MDAWQLSVAQDHHIADYKRGLLLISNVDFLQENSPLHLHLYQSTVNMSIGMRAPEVVSNIFAQGQVSSLDSCSRHNFTAFPREDVNTPFFEFQEF